ncbi:Ca-activated chloride channel family protein [Oceanobacillus limi]|uniref:Ca-activated chloride channel family protein n=1 Tax=Oceanobacillus limi TaxID=930131 RepID=A0A1I0D7N7_9BACI|nr:Ca-activated chloride channel family protein [Oceanobacillus limi]
MTNNKYIFNLKDIIVEMGETSVIRIFMLAVFMTIILLVGCTKDDEEKTNATVEGQQDTEANVDEGVAEEVQNGESISPSDLQDIVLPESKQEMEQQQGGILVEKLTLEEELEKGIEDIQATLDDELREHLKDGITEDLDLTQLEKVVSFLFATPNYPTVLAQADNFEPNFEEPYLPYPGKVSEETENTVESEKAIILLDASSSMLLAVDGEVKMDIAKKAVGQFAEVIGQNSEISLVVYGHQGSESSADKELSCNGIEELYEMAPYNSEEFADALSAFESKGYTPLAGAINYAATMSEAGSGPITLYIVSDGVETCDGDPVQAAKDFVAKHDQRSVNIIGFDVDQEAEEQLKQVSEVGNGEYFSANNASELKQTIEYEWLPSSIDLAWAFTKAPGPWEILDEYERYDIEHEKIRSIIKKEKERYDYALAVMKELELIPEEKQRELNDAIDTKYRSRMDELRQIRSDKIDQIDAIAEDIKERVNEWTEEMRERKKERGDVW